VTAYIGQEARHAQEHKRFNQVLRRYYPGLQALEQEIRERLDRSRKQDTLSYRMAYTAGYEAITYRLACFLCENGDTWFSSADPRVFGMLVWHMVEEIEHKNVAFDVFQAINGGYIERVRGLYDATRFTLRDIARMTQLMLEADGLWEGRESSRRLRRTVLALFRGLAPGFRHYLWPSHHPSKQSDPPLVGKWRSRYLSGADMRVVNPLEMVALEPAS
jgi:uncharacterized protein